ncbi:MAG: thioether cross-link-forming SCIFF peptide maturase [Firmicutes bacterium]|nr:thioether cross-link-forming SCIFF peptide maturase [Bacillota bacterium]
MIHKYCHNGVYIVMDINSGAVHVVDRLVYDILDYYKKEDTESIVKKLSDTYPEAEIRQSIEELDTLVEQRMLFTPDTYSAVAPFVKKREPVVKALCLHIAHDCNLKCKYCFAEEGEYHGKRELMSAEIGKKAIDMLIKASGSRKNLEIDFFGGEPLMNFNVVKEIVEYARSLEEANNKKFRFTITTNGILLNDEILEYINANMHNLVLSIDGRKEINDKMRPRAGGQGSYDTIVPKFRKAAESRNQTDYYVRGTFTRNNLDFAEDVMHLADLGFKQISVEPVVADESEDYAIREEDLPRIFEEYDRLTDMIHERRQKGEWFNFFHFMIDLTGGPCVIKRLVGCGSGTEYLAVAPSGELYPCHQFVGRPEFKLGTVDTGVTNTEVREKFENCNVYTKSACRECWARFYCSGGCAANSFNAHGDLVTPYEIGCEMQKKRIECAIYLKAVEAEDDKNN